MKVGSTDMGVRHAELRVKVRQIVAAELVTLAIANDNRLKRNLVFVDPVGKPELSQDMATVIP